MTKVSLKKVVGRGYKRFWNYKGRYRAVKGGRGSKKSKTAALWFIANMMKYPEANTLVIRRRFNTHRDSTFADLVWAIHQLQVAHLWEWTVSPLEIRYKQTGQKVLFRGLDDAQSITSITVSKGYLCWCWFEEAYQVMKEDDFDKVDMSIRGDTGGLFKQITLTFNPWNEKHWLKRRFFDDQDEDILAITTTYQCNEFLDAADHKRFEWMRKHKPRRYAVEGEGNWGIAEGIIYEDWVEREFDWHEIAKREHAIACFGLDFGYTVDPTAFIAVIADPDMMELYIFDEHYEKAMKNDEIAQMLKDKGYAKESITADAAEPKSIDEIKREEVYNIHAAEKGPDSIRNGIQRLQQYKIIIHPRCENTLLEISNYVWARDKNDQPTNSPIDDFNHLMDALRYATERLKKNQHSWEDALKALAEENEPEPPIDHIPRTR